MLISKVRTYLKKGIKDYSADYREHKDAFNRENIPTTLIDRSYHIAYSVGSITNDNVLETSNIQATIVFYFKGYRDTQKSFDDAMNEINLIKNELCSIHKVAEFRATDSYPIQTCEATSMIPEQLGNNDNSIIITLELELEVIQARC